MQPSPSPQFTSLFLKTLAEPDVTSFSKMMYQPTNGYLYASILMKCFITYALVGVLHSYQHLWTDLLEILTLHCVIIHCGYIKQKIARTHYNTANEPKRSIWNAFSMIIPLMLFRISHYTWRCIILYCENKNAHTLE